jgi:hypothetical protein
MSDALSWDELWPGIETPYAKLLVLEMVEAVARGCCALHGLVVPATDWDRWKCAELLRVWPPEDVHLETE